MSSARKMNSSGRITSQKLKKSVSSPVLHENGRPLVLHEAAACNALLILNRASRSQLSEADSNGLTPGLTAAQKGNLDALKVIHKRGSVVKLSRFNYFRTNLNSFPEVFWTNRTFSATPLCICAWKAAIKTVSSTCWTKTVATLFQSTNKTKPLCNWPSSPSHTLVSRIWNHFWQT